MFGRRRKKQDDTAAEAPSEHPALAATHAAADAFWATVGTSDADVITYLVNPMFMGAPAWPGTRQAYRVVRTPQTLIIASDGLSDPDPDGQDGASGLGCEVFLETPDLVGADFDAIRSSWAFPLIENFAQNVAGMGGIAHLLRQHGVLSMELPVTDGVPATMVSEQETVGALIGVPTGRPSSYDAPLGPVEVVPLTLVDAADLVTLTQGGAETRQALAQQRAADGRGHVTTLR